MVSIHQWLSCTESLQVWLLYQDVQRLYVRLQLRTPWLTLKVVDLEKNLADVTYDELLYIEMLHIVHARSISSGRSYSLESARTVWLLSCISHVIYLVSPVKQFTNCILFIS